MERGRSGTLPREVVKKMWRKIATIALVSLLAAFLQPVATAHAAAAVNGGFETGDFTGWTVANPCGNAPGNWFVYSGTTSPLTGAPLSAPPEGTFAATSDQVSRGTHVLYQDIALDPGHSTVLSFSLYYH